MADSTQQRALGIAMRRTQVAPRNVERVRGFALRDARGAREDSREAHEFCVVTQSVREGIDVNVAVDVRSSMPSTDSLRRPGL
jgi:hypothetical protein